ncbi:MAG: hypothetical protein ABSC21_06635 [Terriglobia bacterium]
MFRPRPSRQGKMGRCCVTQYALCITDAEPDLQPRKVYRILPDRIASKDNYLRVIDESGEDYLYPDRYFVLIKLPQKAESALSVAT